MFWTTQCVAKHTYWTAYIPWQNLSRHRNFWHENLPSYTEDTRISLQVYEQALHVSLWIPNPYRSIHILHIHIFSRRSQFCQWCNILSYKINLQSLNNTFTTCTHNYYTDKTVHVQYLLFLGILPYIHEKGLIMLSWFRVKRKFHLYPVLIYLLKGT